MPRTQEEKEKFYENLGECVDDAKNDSIIILGDLNPRVGKDWLLWPPVLGKHGVGNMNSNGLMLLEFCSRHHFTVMGSMFQPKDSLKTTLQHLRSKHWHQIDDALANKPAKQHITVTKVYTKADCLTDHRFLICKCSFRILCKKKCLKPPTKLGCLMSTERKERLEQFLKEKLPKCKHEWEEFKTLLLEQRSILSRRRRKCLTIGLSTMTKKFVNCWTTRDLIVTSSVNELGRWEIIGTRNKLRKPNVALK